MRLQFVFLPLSVLAGCQSSGDNGPALEGSGGAAAAATTGGTGGAAGATANASGAASGGVRSSGGAASGGIDAAGSFTGGAPGAGSPSSGGSGLGGGGVSLGGRAAAGSNQGGSSGMNAAGRGGLAGAGATGGNGGVAQGGAASGGNAGSSGSSSGGASSGLVYPPATGAGDVAAGIAQLNKYRATLGQNSVTLDQPSSAGCLGHLEYLVEEAQKLGQTGYLEHTETDHDNSHYSAENEQAGKQSDLAFGQSGGKGGSTGQSFGQAVDLWINGLYHRHPLLDPGLVKVGASSLDGYNCLNYAATGNTTTVVPVSPVLWPADGMSDVPRAFGGNEGPCPTNVSNPLAGGTCAGSGFIISATFYNWGTRQKSAINSVSSVTLTNAATQAVVPLLAWYAGGVSGHDPASGYMQDAIAIVPSSALDASTTYRVEISAMVKSADTPLNWTFTTGTRSR